MVLTFALHPQCFLLHLFSDLDFHCGSQLGCVLKEIQALICLTDQKPCTVRKREFYFRTNNVFACLVLNSLCSVRRILPDVQFSCQDVKLICERRMSWIAARADGLTHYNIWSWSHAALSLASIYTGCDSKLMPDWVFCDAQSVVIGLYSWTLVRVEGIFLRHCTF